MENMKWPFMNLCPDCPPTIKCIDGKYCGPNLPNSGILNNDIFAVALQKMDNALNTLVRPYKVYTALVSQNGVYNPIITELENTIGNIAWTRPAPGVLVASAAPGAFVTGKTAIFLTTPLSGPNAGMTIISTSPISDDAIVVQVYVNGLTLDYVLENMSFEIRVYN